MHGITTSLYRTEFDGPCVGGPEHGLRTSASADSFRVNHNETLGRFGRYKWTRINVPGETIPMGIWAWLGWGEEGHK